MYINKLGLLQINVNSFSRQFDYARSLCNYGTIIRQILCNYSIGTNLYIVPNLYITQTTAPAPTKTLSPIVGPMGLFVVPIVTF